MSINQTTTQTAALEAVIFKSGQNYLEDQGFMQLFPPRVVRASGACENIDTLFTVASDSNNLWWQSHSQSSLPAYLAQTGQLYLEAFVPQLNKVYCIGPSFRAEPAIDNRHLTEFTMTEIEFKGNFDQLLNYIEGFIKAIAYRLVNHCEEAINFWGLNQHDLTRLATLPARFPKITYDEAIEILKSHNENIKWGDDISSAQEKKLVQFFGGQPLFITRYPDPMWNHGQEIEVEKFFNMVPDPLNPGRVLSTDLILPYAGESVGAAERIHDVETLRKRLTNSKMYKRLLKKGGSVEDFGWYIENLEKNGSVPHAGCGFGMARIIQWVSGADSITKAITFPSNRGNLI